VTKRTVTRVFVASLITAAAGAILAFIAIALGIANDIFVMSGNDVTGIRQTPLAMSLLVFVVVGVLTVIGGAIAGLIAWIGALLNTWQLESKTWFAVLLLTGIFNFGFIAMVAYVIAGPDGRASAAMRAAPAPSAA
jgi:hypothetical protein